MSRGDENMPVIFGGLLVSVALTIGLVMWGRSRASASPSSPSAPLPPGFTPIVLFPDLKAGDSVVVDSAAANIPNAAPLLVCTVDLVMTDRSLVSVRAVATSFAGTIPRSSIVRVLVPPPAGDFT